MCRPANLWARIVSGRSSDKATPTSFLANQTIGKAGRLGETVAGAAAKGGVDGGIEGDAMADADEDRLDAVPGSDSRTHPLAAIHQRGVRTSAYSRFITGSHKHALRDADARSIEYHPDMASESEASRMGQPLAVEHEQVRLAADLPQCSQQRGGFAKRKQARNVGKRQLRAGHMLLEHFARRHVPDDHARDAHRPIPFEGQIRTGYETDSAKAPAGHHPVREAALQGDRLGRGDGP